MASCVIFCAGGFTALAEPIEEGDLVLAADGGLTHTRSLGLTPGGILGDFDSLGYVPEAAQVFPVEKDDTDSMLAVKQGLALGYRRFVLYGALDGPRLDHTIANLQTLQFLAEHGAEGYLVGLNTLVTVAAALCLDGIEVIFQRQMFALDHLCQRFGKQKIVNTGVTQDQVC